MSRAQLETIIEEARKKSFVAGYKATDAECLGLILARHFGYVGLDILKATYYALEDSNFHTENLVIELLIEQLGGSL